MLFKRSKYDFDFKSYLRTNMTDAMDNGYYKQKQRKRN